MANGASDLEKRINGCMPMNEFLYRKDYNNFNWEDALDNPSEQILDHGDRSSGNSDDLLPQRHVRLRAHSQQGLWVPFRQGKMLGHGTARVYPCFQKPGTNGICSYPRALVLKIIDNTKVDLDEALLEVKIMERLRHPHIVSYVASYEMEDPVTGDGLLGIVLFPKGNDLKKILTDISKLLERKRRSGQNSPIENCAEVRQLFGYFGCLAQTLSYLHMPDTQIKHKDIKPENIIVDNYKSPLIADFGISKRYKKPGDEVTTGGIKHTLQYAPPEAFEPKLKWDYRGDVFSLGCVFAEMVTLMFGVPLSEFDDSVGRHGKQSYCKFIPGLKRWLKKDLVSRAAIGRTDFGEKEKAALSNILPVISQMLDKDANKRPYSKQLWDNFKPLYDYTEEGKPCPTCNRPVDNLQWPSDLENNIKSMPDLMGIEMDILLAEPPQEGSDGWTVRLYHTTKSQAEMLQRVPIQGRVVTFHDDEGKPVVIQLDLWLWVRRVSMKRGQFLHIKKPRKL